MKIILFYFFLFLTISYSFAMEEEKEDKYSQKYDLTLKNQLLGKRNQPPEQEFFLPRAGSYLYYLVSQRDEKALREILPLIPHHPQKNALLCPIQCEEMPNIAKIFRGISPLGLAAYLGYREIVLLFLNDSSGMLVPKDLYACIVGGDLTILQDILKKNPQLLRNPVLLENYLPLHTATELCQGDTVRFLLETKIPELRKVPIRYEGWTALHLAAAVGCPEVVTILLDSNYPEFRKRTDHGMPALLPALMNRNIQVINILLEYNIEETINYPLIQERNPRLRQQMFCLLTDHVDTFLAIKKMCQRGWKIEEWQIFYELIKLHLELAQAKDLEGQRIDYKRIPREILNYYFCTFKKDELFVERAITLAKESNNEEIAELLTSWSPEWTPQIHKHLPQELQEILQTYSPILRRALYGQKKAPVKDPIMYCFYNEITKSFYQDRRGFQRNIPNFSTRMKTRYRDWKQSFFGK